MLIIQTSQTLSTANCYLLIQRKNKANSATLTYLFNLTQKYRARELVAVSSDRKKINSCACIHVDWKSFRIFHSA